MTQYTRNDIQHEIVAKSTIVNSQKSSGIPHTNIPQAAVARNSRSSVLERHKLTFRISFGFLKPANRREYCRKRRDAVALCEAAPRNGRDATLIRAGRAIRAQKFPHNDKNRQKPTNKEYNFESITGNLRFKLHHPNIVHLQRL
ncbi:hypothetical protein Y032_0002g541 [Ancylostoma ceylanicum]|uniref:Uncharacterized protein n=1 Tax=Ancylostoma ceylanicum TaxID=53326 RepID=A0A016W135_9BILA|nr:hypothetical protein Y032_0002g541 [Ancylostoma ceylanicum]